MATQARGKVPKHGKYSTGCSEIVGLKVQCLTYMVQHIHYLRKNRYWEVLRPELQNKMEETININDFYVSPQKLIHSK
jgi:hypothetical protein